MKKDIKTINGYRGKIIISVDMLHCPNTALRPLGKSTSPVSEIDPKQQ